MHGKRIATWAALGALGVALAFGGCKRKEVEKEEEPAAPRYDEADRLGLTGAPWTGAIDGAVTIVEFSNYSCGFCGRVQPTLKKLLEEFPNDVRLVFKHNPSPRMPNSGPAAEAAIEAHAQGKFWEFHYVLMENQRALSRDDLERYAEKTGLDMERFRKALDDGIHKPRIEKDLATAKEMGIRGTPNFLINGRSIVGARPYDDFAAAVREELAAARKMLDEGKQLGEVFAARVEANLAAKPKRPERPKEPEGPVEIEVGDSVAMGNKDAKVVLVEFSDFKCGFCGRLSNTIAEVKGDYLDRVLFVKKQFPLGRWPESQKAAEAALAAHAQGKHDELVALIYENQRTFNDEMLFELAEKAGLNMKRFRKEMEAGTWAEQVKKDREAGQKIGVRGTPALYLNGNRIGGALPAEKLREAIDKALEG